jgi:hypothetical protein
MITFDSSDFETPEGRVKAANFLNGVQETLNDLVHANQEKLIAMGKAYAKPENLDA